MNDTRDDDDETDHRDEIFFSSLFALLALTLSLFFVQSEASAFLATDKNFDSAVLGSNKNVFVKFLAPW